MWLLMRKTHYSLSILSSVNRFQNSVFFHGQNSETAFVFPSSRKIENKSKKSDKVQQSSTDRLSPKEGKAERRLENPSKGAPCAPGDGEQRPEARTGPTAEQTRRRGAASGEHITDTPERHSQALRIDHLLTRSPTHTSHVRGINGQTHSRWRWTESLGRRLGRADAMHHKRAGLESWSQRVL